MSRRASWRTVERQAQQRGETGDTRRQIFAATERLLERVSVHELSVAQIIEQAKVSRATFYFYFGSKYAVIAGLLTQVMDQIYEVTRPFIERADDEPPQVALRHGIEAASELWSSHRPALRAISEHWHAVPELRAMWLEAVERFTEAFAGEIDRQRRDGLAPPGIDSHQLASSLLWSTERCFYVAGLGVEEVLPSEVAAVDALYALWHGGIYGGRPADVAAPAAARRIPSARAGRQAGRGRRAVL